MSREMKDAAYKTLAQLGKALGHPLRLELMDLLAQRPHSVEALASATGRSMASTSQHLQLLASARLVDRARDGVRVIYRLPPAAATLLVSLEAAGNAQSAELRAVRTDWLARHPDVVEISAEELEARRGEVFLIDVRPAEEFAHGHLDGAVSVPLDTLDAALSTLSGDQEVIAYCRGPWCSWADEAVVRLHAAGFRARRFEGRPF